MVIKLNQVEIFTIKLTPLQETIIEELEKTNNQQFICKKFNIKPITLSKTLQVLESKSLIYENKLTDKGKKMVHYLQFRNETIDYFLHKNHIEATNEILKQMRALDLKIIIALKNL